MTPEERAFIEKMRGWHADASTDIRERIVGTDHFLEGRLIPQHPHTPIALFDLGADQRDITFYLNAHRAIGLLLRARDQAIAYFRTQNPAPPAEPERKAYSPGQNCGKWCGDRMFQRFMHEVHGLEHPQDRNRMATKMHSLLGVSSRADLDTNEDAAQAWHDLRAAFKSWRETKL